MKQLFTPSNDDQTTAKLNLIDFSISKSPKAHTRSPPDEIQQHHPGGHILLGGTLDLHLPESQPGAGTSRSHHAGSGHRLGHGQLPLDPVHLRLQLLDLLLDAHLPLVRLPSAHCRLL